MIILKHDEEECPTKLSFYFFSYTFSSRFLDFTILNRGYTNTTLRLNCSWDCVSSHLLSCLFSQTQMSADTKKKGNPKLQYSWLMKLVIGILILDRPPNLAISWPCFKRMVTLSIRTYLIPYNHFLPFFSLLVATATVPRLSIALRFTGRTLRTG